MSIKRATTKRTAARARPLPDGGWRMAPPTMTAAEAQEFRQRLNALRSQTLLVEGASPAEEVVRAIREEAETQPDYPGAAA